MRRVVVVKLDGDGVTAAVRIAVDTNGRGLTRGEARDVALDMASRIMAALPGTRYAGFTLARSRVVGRGV
jgi:hypothetical protein